MPTVEQYGFAVSNRYTGRVTPNSYDGRPPSTDGEAIWGFENPQGGAHFVMTQLNGQNFGLESLDLWFWDVAGGVFGQLTG